MIYVDSKSTQPEKETYKLTKPEVNHQALFNSLFDSTFEQSTLGNALIDVLGNLLRINMRLIEFTGFSFEELSGRYFKCLTGCEVDAEESQVYYLLSIQETGMPTNQVFSFHRPDGREIQLMVSISRVLDQHGELSFYIKSFEDVTELRQSEVMIQRMAQEFDHFVYRAFHDLQGPLASIEGICNLMRMSSSSSDISQYADMISKVSVKMKKALMGMLEAAKINDLESEEVLIDFEEMISNLLTDIRKLPEFEMVSLEYQVQPGIRLQADPTYLHIIIKHLLENAVIFQDTPKKQAWVKVEILQEQSETVIIRVSDNGIGIADAEQGEVFKMFCRKSLKSRGAGIGLYLVKQSVEKLGGDILLRSQVGEGTFVEISL